MREGNLRPQPSALSDRFKGSTLRISHIIPPDPRRNRVSQGFLLVKMLVCGECIVFDRGVVYESERERGQVDSSTLVVEKESMNEKGCLCLELGSEERTELVEEFRDVLTGL